MSGPVDSISKMISENNVNNGWKIEKEDLCKSQGGNCEPGKSFQVKATYVSSAGDEIIFSGPQAGSGFFQPKWVTYNGLVNGKRVSLMDFNTAQPHDCAVGVWKPDGKITEKDQLLIEGVAYFLSRDNCTQDDSGNQRPEVFTFTTVINDPSKKPDDYNGVKLMPAPNGDKWIYEKDGFKDENANNTGQHLAKFLESIGKRYSSALREAAKQVRGSSPPQRVRVI